MFFLKRNSGPSLSDLKTTHSLNRGIIDSKMASLQQIDSDFATVIRETTQLAHSIKSKIDGKLKLTRNDIASICQNIKEGVLLVDYSGHVIESNKSCETIFGVEKTKLLGRSMQDVLSWVSAEQGNENNELVLSETFFMSLSRNLFSKSICKKTCHSCSRPYCFSSVSDYFDDMFDENREIHMRIQPNYSDRAIKMNLSFSVLDNDPEKAEDICYFFFFKLQ